MSQQPHARTLRIYTDHGAHTYRVSSVERTHLQLSVQMRPLAQAEKTMG